jgi:hypothetical protein
MKQILKESQNVCLNGKDPKTMSSEQRMEEFIKGPCSPAIIIPGIAGTSLQVKQFKKSIRLGDDRLRDALERVARYFRELWMVDMLFV